MSRAADERIDQGVLRYCGHVERMVKNRIAKRLYVGECDGSSSAFRPWKRWIDTVNECLRKICLDVRQTRKMLQDRSICILLWFNLHSPPNG